MTWHRACPKRMAHPTIRNRKYRLMRCRRLLSDLALISLSHHQADRETTRVQEAMRIWTERKQKRTSGEVQRRLATSRKRQSTAWKLPQIWCLGIWMEQRIPKRRKRSRKHGKEGKQKRGKLEKLSAKFAANVSRRHGNYTFTNRSIQNLSRTHVAFVGNDFRRQHYASHTRRSTWMRETSCALFAVPISRKRAASEYTWSADIRSDLGFVATVVERHHLTKICTTICRLMI